MADVNLFFDPIRNEDAGYQFINDTLQAAAAPSTIKKIYIGSTQATNVIYVDASGVQKTNIKLYSGSTQVWGQV